MRLNEILHLKMLADLGEQETSEMNEKCLSLWNVLILYVSLEAFRSLSSVIRTNAMSIQ